MRATGQALREGQRVTMDPVYKVVSRANPIAYALSAPALEPTTQHVMGKAPDNTAAYVDAMARAAGEFESMMTPPPVLRPTIHAISHYEEVELKWMKPAKNPDGTFKRRPDGTILLVPKKQRKNS